MASVISDKIPTKIPNKVDQSVWIDQSIGELNHKIAKLMLRVKDLESNQPKTKVSPVEQRAKILRDKAIKNSISSRKAMQILSVNSRMQAIRAMKKAAEIYDDLIIHQYSTSHKSYRLLAKAMAGEPEHRS